MHTKEISEKPKLYHLNCEVSSKRMEQNWNFQEGRGGGEPKQTFHGGGGGGGERTISGTIQYSKWFHNGEDNRLF